MSINMVNKPYILIGILIGITYSFTIDLLFQRESKSAEYRTVKTDEYVIYDYKTGSGEAFENEVIIYKDPNVEFLNNLRKNDFLHKLIAMLIGLSLVSIYYQNRYNKDNTEIGKRSDTIKFKTKSKINYFLFGLFASTFIYLIINYIVILLFY